MHASEFGEWLHGMVVLGTTSNGMEAKGAAIHHAKLCNAANFVVSVVSVVNFVSFVIVLIKSVEQQQQREQ